MIARVQELRERLKVVKRRAEETAAATRADILRSKQDSAAALAEKARGLRRIRSLAHAQAAARKGEAARAAAAAAAEARRARDDGILRVAEGLAEKRVAMAADKARLAAAAKRAAFLRQQQGTGAAQIEVARMKDVRSGAERTAKMRQAAALRDAAAQCRLAQKDATLRLQHWQRGEKGRVAARKATDAQAHEHRVRRNLVRGIHPALHIST